MKIIAHRCGTDCCPEQTINAARFSLEAGADYIEVDIRFTRDGIPVVIHDPTPEGLYGVNTPVCEMTAAEFLALRRTADASVCGHAFAHYLACGIDRMLFHCKEGGERLKQVLDMCERQGIADKVVFGLQSAEDVRRIKAYDARVQVLAFMQDRTRIEEFAAAGVDSIRLWQQWLCEESVSRVKATGRNLWIMSCAPNVGEVTGDADYAAFAAWGADGVLVNEVLPAVAYYRSAK